MQAYIRRIMTARQQPQRTEHYRIAPALDSENVLAWRGWVRRTCEEIADGDTPFQTVKSLTNPRVSGRVRVSRTVFLDFFTDSQSSTPRTRS